MAAPQASNPASRRAFPARPTPVSPHSIPTFSTHRTSPSIHQLSPTMNTPLTPPLEIDNLTDRAGMGDKYDDKINKFADGQINNQVPGGAGSK